jgi:hypothetical protein
MGKTSELLRVRFDFGVIVDMSVGATHTLVANDQGACVLSGRALARVCANVCSSVCASV